ncbi:MAG: conserved hypothetical rane protein, partial [Marmoricola sp.]|nr:conserved hypothetical rane protein [Marmoricola sp.]
RGGTGGVRGGFGGRPGAAPGGTTGQTGTRPTGGTARPTGGTAGGSAAGGLLNASTPSTAIVTLLSTNASDYTWAAAAIGSNTASGYQLATQLPVMAIGGFNGSDPSPTLTQFQAYVKAGKIHWFIASGGQGGGPSAGGSSSSAISAWVEAHYTARTVSGITFYDLTSSTS